MAAAIVVLLLLVVLSAVLLIPFDVSFKVAAGRPALAGEVSIRWLGLGLRRSISGRQRAQKPRSPGKKRKLDPAKTVRLFREAVPSFDILLRALKKSVSLRRLSLEVNLGLDDPAETATLSGYVWAVSWIANLFPNVSFVFTPDFEKATLDGSAAADLRVRLLPLVAGFLKAYAKRPFRELMRQARG